jgi:hypothetical protein
MFRYCYGIDLRRVGDGIDPRHIVDGRELFHAHDLQSPVKPGDTLRKPSKLAMREYTHDYTNGARHEWDRLLRAEPRPTGFKAWLQARRDHKAGIWRHTSALAHAFEQECGVVVFRTGHATPHYVWQTRRLGRITGPHCMGPPYEVVAYINQPDSRPLGCRVFFLNYAATGEPCPIYGRGFCVGGDRPHNLAGIVRTDSIMAGTPAVPCQDFPLWPKYDPSIVNGQQHILQHTLDCERGDQMSLRMKEFAPAVWAQRYGEAA